jgi:tRNA(fMet)-specific endonuclease VapC
VNRALIDTNAYSAFMAGDERVLDVLAAAGTTFVSVVVIGELHAGLRGGSRWHSNRAQLSAFLDRPTVRVLDIGRETAEVFGQVKDTLRRAGSPIPIADVWLAAQAIESGAAIVSYDAHFLKVPGLRIWDALGHAPAG